MAGQAGGLGTKALRNIACVWTPSFSQIWGGGDSLNLPKMLSFRFPLVGKYFNTLEESRDKCGKGKGPRVCPFPRRNVAPAARLVGFRAGPGRSADSACGSTAGGSGQGSRARPALCRSPDSQGPA